MSLPRATILSLILLELLSFFAWLYPPLNAVCFFVILLLVLWLSLRDLSHGLLLALGELIIGSHGYLFSLNINQGATFVSLRLGLFLVIMLAWVIHTLKYGLATYWRVLTSFQFFKYYLFLAVVLVWGFVWGIVRGNDFGNLFLDFNNWLFFLYLLPLIDAAGQKDFWPNLKNLSLVCLAWLIFKTLLFFYIFAHQFIWALPEAYLWVRDTKVGEITRFTETFYRVFFQSQIFSLLGFFILLPLIKKIHISRPPLFANPARDGEQAHYSVLAMACLSVVIVSLSRSFWAGLILGLLAYLVVIIYQLLTTHWSLRLGSRFLIRRFIVIFSIAFLSLALLFTIAYAPPQISGNLASLFRDRATTVEAAGSSRLNMLKPLLLSIGEHPVIGSGFGTTVTYKSSDPRIVPATAGGTGEFTTYAFEWGYLDLLLKFGLFGVFIYLLLIFKLLQALWQKVKSKTPNPKSKINLNDKSPKPITSYELQVASAFLPLGFFLATLALLAVNIFTPYLNHPLGIGFILVISVWLDFAKTQNSISN